MRMFYNLKIFLKFRTQRPNGINKHQSSIIILLLDMHCDWLKHIPRLTASNQSAFLFIALAHWVFMKNQPVYQLSNWNQRQSLVYFPYLQSPLILSSDHHNSRKFKHIENNSSLCVFYLSIFLSEAGTRYPSPKSPLWIQVFFTCGSS